MVTLDKACTKLGVPVAEHNHESQATCLPFLRIEMDTQAGSLRLPLNKLSRLQVHLGNWGDRKACTRCKLESLIGLLNHAYKVVWSGHAFQMRMINLLQTVPMHPLKPHPIRLNTEFHLDLAWWIFLSKWNGVHSSHHQVSSQLKRWPQMHRGHGAVAHGTVINGFRCHEMIPHKH